MCTAAYRSLSDLQLTRPVAHQHASLASSTTILFPFALASSLRNLAADVPVMPVPTITISASEGSFSVVRCPSKNSFGSLCQKEFVDVGVGREARGCFIVIGMGVEVGWMRSACGGSLRLCRYPPYLVGCSVRRGTTIWACSFGMSTWFNPE